MARGESAVLFPAEERVDRFTITTGSTGVPKLNPITPTWLREYRRSWDLWGSQLLCDHLSIVGDKILQVVGSWDMGRTPAGIPISMVSALLARHQHPLARPFFAVPHEVTDIRDPVARYYAIMRLCLPERIGLIVLMNPGNLLRLAHVGNEQRDALIRDIADGTVSPQFDIPAEIRHKLAARLRAPQPQRARQLEQIVERTGALYPKDYWPRPVIACWLGGTAGYQSRYLPEYFGDAPLRDQGLVSSEGRHTIPFEDGKPEGVLAINNGFYEFVPVADIDAACPDALEGHELQVDRDYYLVMTTYSGYFRFNIGDVVRCRGFVGEAPVLEFLQKGERCGDLEGEKVTEHQFLEAATGAARNLQLRLGLITAVPSLRDRELPCYEVVVEDSDFPDLDVAGRFLEDTDHRLRASNFLYSARRREGVLGPMKLVRIPQGGWTKCIEAEIERRGTGEAHYKHPGLLRDAGWLTQFRSPNRVQATAASLDASATIEPSVALGGVRSAS